MLNDLKKLKDDAIREFKKVKESEELRNLETKYLGRKGELTNLLRKVKDLSAQEKPKVGKLANEIKIELAKAVNSVKHELGEAVDSVTGNNIDVTLPGMDFKSGHYHPLTLVQKQLEQIFERMGFMVLEGPELESEHYNFEALNIPDSHPARDTMDTYYIKNKENWVLRTHTSSQQVRAIEKYGAPLRAVFPGRCFRYEATDASHDTTFNQLEGLMIDKDISIANIIAVMKSLLKEVLQKDVKVQ